MRHFHGIGELRAAVGERLGTSEWHPVPQQNITAFAEATLDFERIHLDPDRAAEAGLPGTIAHGLYTLSMGPALLYQIYDLSGAALGLNYGFDKVRFLNPVPADSRIRLHLDLIDATDIPGGCRFTFRQTFEIEGRDKPACVAESLVAYFDSLPSETATEKEN